MRLDPAVTRRRANHPGEGPHPWLTSAVLPLRTDAFVLRALVPCDAPDIAAYRSDPEVARYQSWATPFPVDKVDAAIARFIAEGGPQEDSFFTIGIADPVTDELFGDVALKLEWAGRSAEIGYTLARPHHGRGLASGAVFALLDHLFSTTDLRRAHATLHPDNHPSARLLERLGFEYEGTDREGFWVVDECSDDVRYGVLRDEWRAWHAPGPGRPARVDLVEIDAANRDEVRRLRVHRSQERLVSSVTKSLADALIPDLVDGVPVTPWYRAVEADGTLVGFVMLAEQTEHLPDPYLWRLLIDRAHQRRGIGRMVVEALVGRLRTEGAGRLMVSWNPGPGTPEPFYRRLGFVPTGELDGEEIVAALDLVR